MLWNNELLNRKATCSQFIRANAAMKGKPNLTVSTLCEWINEELLLNETLEPSFPCAIHVETARKCMHHRDLRLSSIKRGLLLMA